MSRFELLDEVLQAVGEYTDMGWGIHLTPMGEIWSLTYSRGGPHRPAVRRTAQWCSPWNSRASNR